MQRSITGFFQDEAGDWAARLDCGHAQHTRHNPPFVNRAWVETTAGRHARMGERLECLKCERLELPAGLESYRRTPEFNADNAPAALREQHRTKTGVWARINVLEGTLRYVSLGDERREFILAQGRPGIVAPGMPHYVCPLAPVRFYVEFLRLCDEP